MPRAIGPIKYVLGRVVVHPSGPDRGWRRARCAHDRHVSPSAHRGQPDHGGSPTAKAAGIPTNAQGIGGFVNGARALVDPALVMRVRDQWRDGRAR